MPELPEVETIRRGITPHVKDRTVRRVIVRDHRLRWPVSGTLAAGLTGRTIVEVRRRAKYLLLDTSQATLILHLGMSGRLLIVSATVPAGKHDHLDIVLDSGQALRLHDPRRFGCALWVDGDPLTHPLLGSLGPEPFDHSFSGDYLYIRSRGRKGAVKNFIMDGKIVVGVGNIYANEALFEAGIHPARSAGRISRPRYRQLHACIVDVLQRAIETGGTTLRDFAGADGNPGYFQQVLKVYGKAGAPCPRCANPLRLKIIGQRSTFYCAQCQT